MRKFLVIAVILIGLFWLTMELFGQRIMVYKDLKDFFDYEISFVDFEVLKYRNLGVGNDPADFFYVVELKVKNCEEFAASLPEQPTLATQDDLGEIVGPSFIEKIYERPGTLLISKKSELHYAVSFFEERMCKLHFEYSKF